MWPTYLTTILSVNIVFSLFPCSIYMCLCVYVCVFVSNTWNFNGMYKLDSLFVYSSSIIINITDNSVHRYILYNYYISSKEKRKREILLLLFVKWDKERNIYIRLTTFRSPTINQSSLQFSSSIFILSSFFF